MWINTLKVIKKVLKISSIVERNVEEVKKRVLIRLEELVDAQKAASQSAREAN